MDLLFYTWHGMLHSPRVRSLWLELQDPGKYCEVVAVLKVKKTSSLGMRFWSFMALYLYVPSHEKLCVQSLEYKSTNKEKVMSRSLHR